MSDTTFKAYLGDAVYASWDGEHIVLTVENGYYVTERVCLDASVWTNLLRYHARLEQLLKPPAEPVP
jgi:hypothetical protein